MAQNGLPPPAEGGLPSRLPLLIIIDGFHWKNSSFLALYSAHGQTLDKELLAALEHDEHRDDRQAAGC